MISQEKYFRLSRTVKTSLLQSQSPKFINRIKRGIKTTCRTLRRQLQRIKMFRHREQRLISVIETRNGRNISKGLNFVKVTLSIKVFQNSSRLTTNTIAIYSAELASLHLTQLVFLTLRQPYSGTDEATGDWYMFCRMEGFFFLTNGEGCLSFFFFACGLADRVTWPVLTVVQKIVQVVKGTEFKTS